MSCRWSPDGVGRLVAGQSAEPRPLPERDIRLMRRMDELHLEHPFSGSRMLRRSAEQ
jgi:hypothetical protein